MKSREELAARSRTWREKNPEKARAWVRRSARKRYLKIRYLIDRIKWSRPCKDCGKRYPPYVMDFDHVRGEKLVAVGSTYGLEWSKARILKEAAKCEVVCSNCHRIRTHNRSASKTTGNFKDHAPD